MIELSKTQLTEYMELVSSADETTVKCEGTTEKWRHFNEVYISTETDIYTSGIKEMAGGVGVCRVKRRVSGEGGGN